MPVTKNIDETEKNIGQVFDMPEATKTLLLFDDAEALFGKRTEVRDVRNHYANAEIAYLRQKLEEFPGITILTTNLGEKLDLAFPRRFAFIVEFPYPVHDEC